MEAAEDRANEHLLHLIPKDVLSKTLSQYYCEIESDFLCFALPYEAVAKSIPTTVPVIDFGCYMAAQAYFFRNRPAYVGVDCYEMYEDFSSLRRFSLPNCRHYLLGFRTVSRLSKKNILMPTLSALPCLTMKHGLLFHVSFQIIASVIREKNRMFPG